MKASVSHEDCLIFCGSELETKCQQNIPGSGIHIYRGKNPVIQPIRIIRILEDLMDIRDVYELPFVAIPESSAEIHPAAFYVSCLVRVAEICESRTCHDGLEFQLATHSNVYRRPVQVVYRAVEVIEV